MTDLSFTVPQTPILIVYPLPSDKLNSPHPSAVEPPKGFFGLPLFLNPREKRTHGCGTRKRNPHGHLAGEFLRFALVLSVKEHPLGSLKPDEPRKAVRSGICRGPRGP